MKQTISMLLVILVMFSCFTGCGQSTEEETITPQESVVESTGTAVVEESASVARCVVDMLGNEVVLPETVDRVFVDWASGITLAMTLGAVDKLVVVPTAFHSDTFAWARIICPAIDSIEANDDAYTNVEVALTYEPDVVITNTEENIEIYNNMGLTPIYVKFNDTESFKQSMLIVGEALGEEELAAAEKYNSTVDANFAMVQERTAHLTEEEKQTVYYVDSRFVDAYHTVGTGEIQESWIVAAGGRLATAEDFEGRNLEITAEKFLEINPDIITIGAQNQAEVYDMLMADELLGELSAVQNGEVYRIPQGIFPWCRTGPEAAIQVIWAGKLLHPELFEDIDIETVARDFYEEFYGADISDEDLQGILSGKLCPTGA